MVTPSNGCGSGGLAGLREDALQNKTLRRRPDPLVATYLAQIQQCPLLNREQEFALAQRLDKSRRLFRRLVLAHQTTMVRAIELLTQLQDKSLRLDRTLEVAVRDQQRKKQLLQALPQHLETVREIVTQNMDEIQACKADMSSTDRCQLTRRIRQRKAKAVQLIEELGIRNVFFEGWWRDLCRAGSDCHRIRQIHGVYIQAKRTLAKHNLRLVVSVARRYSHPGLSLLDLVQEGNVGLLIAVEKFEPERGLRFSTYATWWIVQWIRKAIMEKTRSVRLPTAACERIDRAQEQANAVCQQLGRRLSREELELAGSFSGDEMLWMTVASSPVVSLDQPVGPLDDRAFHESLSQQRESLPDESARQSEFRRMLHEILDRWEPRERAIIKLRFGLDNRKTLTLEEVGSKLCISRERVRQLERASLDRLREQLSFVTA